VAAAPIGSSPRSTERFVISPSHPSELEAEAVSDTILSKPPGAEPPVIRCSLAVGQKLVQRQINWKDRSQLSWADFKGPIPKDDPFVAMTSSTIKPKSRIEPKEVSWPSGPLSPTPCKLGKKTDSEYHAMFFLDFADAVVPALMHPTKSWVKPGNETLALLAHEQGHFDITHVVAEKTSFVLEFWAISNVGKPAPDPDAGGSRARCGKSNALAAAREGWNNLQPGKEIRAILDRADKALKNAQKDYEDQTKHGSNTGAQKDWQGKIVGGLAGYDVLP
jgi:hypothetical protein